jgi:L-asparaginase
VTELPGCLGAPWALSACLIVTGCTWSEGKLLDSSDAILVLTTGGTIDKHYFDALSKYQVAESAVWKLLTNARVTHQYRVDEVVRKDSLDLTDEDRAEIVGRVVRSSFRRIIITHGTDTMSLTAKALTAIVDKTIVLTGALSPARFSDSDAAFNLGMAFATAQTADPGVYITINGSVFRGEEACKDRELERFTRALGQETWAL